MPFPVPNLSIGGNDAFTKLLLHCDGTNASTTFTDSSSAAHTMTANGNAQVSTAQSKFGGASLLCDGSGDYVSSPNSTDWNLGGAGAGDFTIDFWIRFNSVAAAYGLVATGNFGGTGWTFYFVNTSGGQLRLYNGSESVIAWAASTNIWYHVALVRSSSTITCYIGGTSIGTFTDLDMNNDSGALRVGDGGDSGSSFNGWMDEVRISKGIARWTANFAPPSGAYT